LTGTASTPAPAPAPAEYRCRRCGRVLGQECAEGLRLGGALLTRRADIACAGCGRRWVWYGEKSVACPVDNPPPPRA
jgi:DNA-directed RNA polymerase subunit RPC12/RpoP